MDTSLILGLCLVLLEEIQRPQNRNLKILRHSVKKYGLSWSPKKHLTGAPPSQLWESEEYSFNWLNLFKYFIIAFTKQRSCCNRVNATWNWSRFNRLNQCPHRDVQSLSLMSTSLSQCCYQSSAAPFSNSFLPSTAGTDLTGSQGGVEGCSEENGLQAGVLRGTINACHKTVPFPEDILAKQCFQPETSSNMPGFLSSWLEMWDGDGEDLYCPSMSGYSTQRSGQCTWGFTC